MSAVTVVNYYGKRLREIKPSVIPEEYIVPKYDERTKLPGILVVHDAKTILRKAETPDFPVPIPAEELAKDIIEGFTVSQLDYSDETKPAIFWVPGIIAALEVDKKYPQEVAEAKKKQLAWAMKLIHRADDDWAKFKQHRAITDTQRWAATYLHMTNKEWMVDPVPIEQIKCPACGSFVESTVAKCRACGYITNPTVAKSIGLVA